MAGKTTRVVMPQLGESVHEGTISKWLVKPGDKVVEFEPMLEVDTDKVNAEVPAPVSGILREILAKEGQTVQAGAEIAVVETGDGATAPAETPPAAAAPAAEAPVEPSPRPSPLRGEGKGEGREEKSSEAHRYSPGVLMAADELKVDLSRVTGTGLGGRVTKKDVQEFASRGKAAAPA
ncbi:MAG TPA: biotin/lipoyl-containing protein, partial [Candidatus Dormibacteraeota bacterium]|nr:biotin/lipoyl-containing protein [Candidatus Dormibacteraeota bacterium]